jgi:hypothetical protein
VTGTNETWNGINASLNRGIRGLPDGSSLAKLLAEHRGVRNIQNLPRLTVKQILAWADSHKAATGDWPRKTSGQVVGTYDTWLVIDAALRNASRGLPGESSLAKLLAEHRGVRNLQDLPVLTIEQILAWADAHKAATGYWPRTTSGFVAGTEEKWSRIHDALFKGLRGLPGGCSLAKLLNGNAARTP